jgi:hypothetical protein
MSLLTNPNNAMPQLALCGKALTRKHPSRTATLVCAVSQSEIWLPQTETEDLVFVYGGSKSDGN